MSRLVSRDVNEARGSDAKAWTPEAEAWTLEAEATISGLEAEARPRGLTSLMVRVIKHSLSQIIAAI